MDYDATGRLKWVKDPLLQQVSFDYTDRGEKWKTTDPIGNVWDTLDPNGNREIFHDRKGHPWTFSYDKNNRLKTMLSPENRLTSQTYNSRGLVETVTEPSTQATTYLYNSRGWLDTKTDQVGVVGHFYDANGNLEKVTEGSAQLIRTYDSSDRIESYRNAAGELIGYQYDANGNLTRLTYPGGKAVDYFYDVNNRPVLMRDWGLRETKFAWDAAGRLKEIERPNGAKRILTYDAAGQVKRIEERQRNGYVIGFWDLDYDLAGRIKRRHSVPAIPVGLTQEATLNATFDLDNRMLTYNGVTLNYDADGNLKDGPLPVSSQSTLTWDARNRLTSAKRNDTNVTLSFTYDAEGNRIAVTQSGQSGPTRWTINPHGADGLSQGLIRHKPDGSKTYYVYGLGLLYEVNESEEVRFYHSDYLGSTTAITDAESDVIGKAAYSPYGTLVQVSGVALDTPFLFNGRYRVETDHVTGLIHMRARYYNPKLRRFLNPDPIGFSGGQNFYAYADGDPLSYLDPFGFGAESGIIGHVASAVMGALPVIGTIQSAVELVTGEDYLTGEKASRTMAAIGLVMGLFPGGKALISGGGRALSHTDDFVRGGSGVLNASRGGIPKTGVAHFDDLAVNSPHFERVIAAIKARGFRVKASEFIPAYNPTFIKPGNRTFYYNPKYMTKLDLRHELRHFHQLKRAGSLKTGGGLLQTYEREAYQFEAKLGARHGFSDTYMRYLNSVIDYYTRE